MAKQAVAVIGAGWCGITHQLRVVETDHDGDATWIVATPLEAGSPLGALRTLLGRTKPGDDHHAAANTIEKALGDDLLVVDDAHELDEASVRAVAALAERGRSVAVGHRPTTRLDIGALDDVIERNGTVTTLGLLDSTELAGVLAAATGSAVDADLLDHLHERSGGSPGLALALLDDDGALLDDPPRINERVEVELRRTGTGVRALAHVLSIAGPLPDDVVARAAELDDAELTEAIAAVASAGLGRGGRRGEDLELFPAVRAAVRQALSASDRRRGHRLLAAALIDRGGEVIEAAEHLLAAGGTGPEAAELFIHAGDDLRFSQPDDALGWYDEAVVAGATNEEVAPGRAEAAAFSGHTGDTDVISSSAGSDPGRARLLAVRAAESSRDGRLARCVELYGQIDDHPVLSGDARTALTTTALVGLGRLDDARDAADPPTDPLDVRADLAHFLGRAVVHHSTAPVESAPLFVEAAEALERIDLDLILPDSPHAVGALCLTLSGDLPAAETLLQRAVVAAPAGPAFDDRHRLLMAWVHLRSARYELPVAELAAVDASRLDTRDQLLHAAIRAGLARRSGDVPRLREAWSGAEPVLLRGVGDLLHLEPLAELILAAVRLRQFDRARPVLEALEGAVELVGEARAWTVPAAWLDVQLAVENGDAAATGTATDRLVDISPVTDAQRAIREAAQMWCRVLDEDIEPDAVVAAASELSAAHLPWEASRLAGQAAIRVRDAAVARRLLEAARTYHHDPESPSGATDSDAGLTAREVDVGRYVVDGLTYREIGAQLYISPKTVEHHVARIRRKLQASSRAEMLAALRALLFDDGEQR